MCKIRFFVCKHCGNVVGLIHNAGVPIMCCGEKMVELSVNTVEASTEKHLPVVNVDGDRVFVQIGEVAHPMVDEHHIEWVYLQTDRGGQRKCLELGTEPKVSFALVDEKPLAVYAYCNIHGLWRTDVE